MYILQWNYGAVWVKSWKMLDYKSIQNKLEYIFKNHSLIYFWVNEENYILLGTYIFNLMCINIKMYFVIIAKGPDFLYNLFFFLLTFHCLFIL